MVDKLGRYPSQKKQKSIKVYESCMDMINDIIDKNDHGVDGKDLVLSVAVFQLWRKSKHMNPNKLTELLLQEIYELQDKGLISMNAKKIHRG